MRHLKELQIFVKVCENEEIVKILTNESMISDTRRAFGNYLFSPTEVITHRSVLSYRIKKILHRNGILWSGDPMDVNVTRILMQVRKHIAPQSTGSKNGLPVCLPDASP
jgi:hypothetical protein